MRYSVEIIVREPESLAGVGKVVLSRGFGVSAPSPGEALRQCVDDLVRTATTESRCARRVWIVADFVLVCDACRKRLVREGQIASDSIKLEGDEKIDLVRECAGCNRVL